MPRKPKALPKKIDGHIRRLSVTQRAHLLELLQSESAVDKLAEIVACYGAPYVGPSRLPADVTVVIAPIVAALSDALQRLDEAPNDIRDKIASRVTGASRGEWDLSALERHLLSLTIAAQDAMPHRRGGRPENVHSKWLAIETQRVIVRTAAEIKHGGGGSGWIPLRAVWRDVLSVVIEAAELPLDAARLIATIERDERRKRTNKAKSGAT